MVEQSTDVNLDAIIYGYNSSKLFTYILYIYDFQVSH